MSQEENIVSINELKDMKFSEAGISPKQRLAIKNFDRYRHRILSSIKSEEKFHQEFQKLQVKANLTSYEEFLKEDYL